MNRLVKMALLILFAVSSTEMCMAQKFAAKTNLLDDALLDINIGGELTIAPKWSIDVPVSLNFWTVHNSHVWKHWAVQPGARYWFCEPYTGHFVGVHAHGVQYNLGNFDLPVKIFGTDFHNLRDSRYQGWGVGAGVSYGYSWLLNRHWNLEAEIGIGYLWTKYDRYECVGCGRKVESGKTHNYFGPTKAAINLVYVF